MGKGSDVNAVLGSEQMLRIGLVGDHGSRFREHKQHPTVQRHAP